MRFASPLMIVGLLFSPNVFGYKVAVVRAEKGTTGVGCDPGDGTAGVDSTFPGPKLKWANTNITYSVNASGLDDLSSDTASQAIAAALSAWTQNSGGILQFNPAPPSNPPASSNPYPCDVGTGSVIFMWSKDNNIVPRDANAITWVKYNKATGEIIGAVVVFNQGRVLMASQYSTSDIFSEQVVWTMGRTRNPAGLGFSVRVISMCRLLQLMKLGMWLVSNTTMKCTNLRLESMNLCHRRRTP